MTAIPIYGKNPLEIFFYRTKGPMALGLSMQHWGLGSYKVCSNYDPRSTLTYFMAKSTWVPYAFVWEIDKKKCISQQPLKSETYNFIWMLNLIITWKCISAKGQGHFLTFVQGDLDLNILYWFCSKAAGPKETKFHLETSWVLGTEGMYQWSWSHDPNGCLCLYMVKTLQNSFSPESKAQWPWLCL